jgi:hypothetical protein
LLYHTIVFFIQSTRSQYLQDTLFPSLNYTACLWLIVSRSSHNNLLRHLLVSILSLNGLHNTSALKYIKNNTDIATNQDMDTVPVFSKRCKGAKLATPLFSTKTSRSKMLTDQPMHAVDLSIFGHPSVWSFYSRDVIMLLSFHFNYLVSVKCCTLRAQ